MIILVNENTTKEEYQSSLNDIPDYLKFVTDIKNQSLRIGGIRHVDAEQLFLEEGSSQTDLWGGGIDIESGYVDYGSMINIRPPTNNSKDVLDKDTRKKIDTILKNKLRTFINLNFEE